MPLQLAFEANGEGLPVVILHGLFGSGRDRRSIAQALSARGRELGVDLRNHGASPSTTTMSYPGMAADVRMPIECKRLDRPVVIGHSMGGKAAMTLALASPAAVGRRVGVDIAPVAYGDRVTPYLETMGGVDTEPMTRRADAVRQVSERIPDARTAAFPMQNLGVREEHHDRQLNRSAIAAAETHRLPDPGRISVIPTVPMVTQRNRTLNGAPAAAEPCLVIDGAGATR